MITGLLAFLKRRLRISIRDYLVMSSVVLTTGATLLIGFFSYNCAVEGVKHQVEALARQTTVQLANKRDYSLNEIPCIVNDLADNGVILDNLADLNPSTDMDVQLTDQNKILQQLYNAMIGLDSPVEGIGIFRKGQALFAGQGVEAIDEYVLQHPAFQDLTATPKPIVLKGDECSISNSGKQTYKGIYYARFLTDPAGIRWILVVKVRGTLLSDLFESNGPGMIYDGDSLIWCSDKSLASMNNIIFGKIEGDYGNFRNRVGNKDYLFSYQRSGLNTWTVVLCNDLQSVSLEIGRLRKISLFVSVICLLVCVALITVFSKSITRSIRLLGKTVEQYRLDHAVEYKNPRRGYSFRLIVFSFFFVLVLLPLSIYITLFYFSSSELMDYEIAKSVNATLVQTADNIDSFIAANERISVRILLNSAVQERLNPSPNGPVVTDDQIYQIIEENLSFERKVFETNLFKSNGDFLLSTSYFNKKYAISANLYESAIHSTGNPIWVSYSVDPYNRNVITLTRKIYATKGRIVNLGYLSLTYFETDVQNLYSDVNIGNGDCNIFIVENGRAGAETIENGLIISSKYKNRIGTNYDMKLANEAMAVVDKAGRLAQRNGTVVFATQCKNISWAVVAEINASFFQSNNRSMLLTNIYAAS